MTNESVDRNFKLLQSTEETLQSVGAEISKLSRELENMHAIADDLGQNQEKVKTASERLATLDVTIKDTEERINNMQVARDWLARTESRLDEIYKQTQSQLGIVESVLKEGGAKAAKSASKGAPPIGTRESVIKLTRQGWKVEEIARVLKISRGEVELIQEMPSKD